MEKSQYQGTDTPPTVSAGGYSCHYVVGKASPGGDIPGILEIPTIIPPRRYRLHIAVYFGLFAGTKLITHGFHSAPSRLSHVKGQSAIRVPIEGIICISILRIM